MIRGIIVSCVVAVLVGAHAESSLPFGAELLTAQLNKKQAASPSANLRQSAKHKHYPAMELPHKIKFHGLNVDLAEKFRPNQRKSFINMGEIQRLESEEKKQLTAEEAVLDKARDEFLNSDLHKEALALHLINKRPSVVDPPPMPPNPVLQAMDAKWRKVCSDTLTTVWRIRDAWIFHTPVVESPYLSHEDKVSYSRVISQPMDLRTIKRNLSSFPSPMEFERNMNLVFSNCALFNKPGQDAYEMGRDVKKHFDSKWSLNGSIAVALYEELLSVAGSVDMIASFAAPMVEPPFYDEVTRTVVERPMGRSVQKSVEKSSTSSIKEESGMVTYSVRKEDMTDAPLQFSSIKSETGPVVAPPSFQSICYSIFSELKSLPSNAWFLLPVHKYSGIPVEVKKQYYSLIKQPMDFETIEKNLPVYPSPSVFRKDLELIVTNAIRFNPPNTVVNTAAIELQNRINQLFDHVHAVDLARFKNLPSEWGKTKRRSGSPVPEDVLPVVGGGASAGAHSIRLVKRLKTSDGGGAEVPNGSIAEKAIDLSPEPKAPIADTGSVSAGTKTPSSVNSFLQIHRPMVVVSESGNVSHQSWQFYANHLINELSQLKDPTSGNKLIWIFQKPIFKYDLPSKIKRLYLLSIPKLVDLSVIQSRLAGTDGGKGFAYSNPAEFETDMTQMFFNCLAFNDESQYPHKAGYVLQRHFEEYWLGAGGLKAKALEAANRRGTPMSNFFSHKSLNLPTVEQPNWNELRNDAVMEVSKQPQNHDIDQSMPHMPLNDELLYEWRVAQRYVLQQLKQQMRESQSADPIIVDQLVNS